MSIDDSRTNGDDEDAWKAMLISHNEDLQTLNAELEAANEEMHSINEMLNTTNDTLHRRNQEVTEANTELLNFSRTVNIPIVTLDLNRKITRFSENAGTIVNALPSDIGRSIHDIKLNIDVPDLERRLLEVMNTSSVFEKEVQDQACHWYRLQIRPYTTLGGVTDGTILSLVDIDGLKQLIAEAQAARADAEHANGAKDDFLANLSHELRTPLSSMLLGAQRLRRGDFVSLGEQKRAGEILERSARKQALLVDNLLDASLIVAGRLSLDFGATDLCQNVNEAIEESRSIWEAKSLAVNFAPDPYVGRIWADGKRVLQIVKQLIGNAIKFTHWGGTVSVVMGAHDGFASLTVTDNGAGIDSAFLPHVFDRFSQHDSSTTREHGGLGLGLSLVRELVEMQGGKVTADSQGVGHGSTFAVTFPLLGNQQGTPASLTPPQRTAGALDRPGRKTRYDSLIGLRVLFIDDDLATREAVYEVLVLAGAKVELAASVGEGLIAVETFKPQVILCDLAMPGEDGYAFIRKLRTKESGTSTPIPALAFSAMSSDETKRRSVASGYQLHLSKPIDIDRLRDAVLKLSQTHVDTPSPR